MRHLLVWAMAAAAWSQALAGGTQILRPPPASTTACAGRAHPHWSRAQCLKAFAASELFERLVRASGRRRLNVRLRFSDDITIDAHYDPDDETLIVDKGFLDRPEEALLGILSHELGHWIQDREGLIDYYKYSHQQVEAHADWLGVRLAARAGFAPTLWLYSRAVAWGCDSMQRSDGYHPTEKDRWVNVKSLAERLARYVRREDRLAVPSQFASGRSPNMFDRQGAIPRKSVLTVETTRRQCLDLAATMDAARGRALPLGTYPARVDEPPQTLTLPLEDKTLLAFPRCVR